MELSNRIKEICKIRGTSMSAVEKQLGLGNGTIGKWGKNGRVPNYANLCAVASALSVSVSDLTGESGAADAKKDLAVSGEVEGSLDAELIQRLIQLSPEEVKQVSAFVQGLLAAR